MDWTAAAVGGVVVADGGREGDVVGGEKCALIFDDVVSQFQLVLQEVNLHFKLLLLLRLYVSRFNFHGHRPVDLGLLSSPRHSHRVVLRLHKLYQLNKHIIKGEVFLLFFLLLSDTLSKFCLLSLAISSFEERLLFFCSKWIPSELTSTLSSYSAWELTVEWKELSFSSNASLFRRGEAAIRPPPVTCCFFSVASARLIRGGYSLACCSISSSIRCCSLRSVVLSSSSRMISLVSEEER